MLHKTLQIDSAGVKFDGENPRIFEGYASVFGSVDSYGDMIMPGAYADTIKEENRNGRPIRLRWNHYGGVIGKWLEVREDDVGLWVRGELTPNHSKASDVAASMQHKAVDGLSIGYWVPEGGSEMDGRIRRLKKINLIEISVVEEPADVNAQITGVKSMLETARDFKDVEAILRDAGGFSRADATALVGRVKSLSHGDRVGDMDTGDIAELLRKRRDFLKKQ